MESQLEIKQEIIADSHEFNDDEEILKTNIKEERNKSPEHYVQVHDIKQEKIDEISVHESFEESSNFAEDPLTVIKFAKKNHMTTVHEGKKYECDFCGKSFKTEIKMKKHVKKIHEGNTSSYNCDFCFENFKTNIQKISKERNDICTECIFRKQFSWIPL